MRNTTIILIAAVTVLLTMAGSLAEENPNAVSANSPTPQIPQTGKPETAVLPPDISKTNNQTDHPVDKTQQDKQDQSMPVSKPPAEQKDFNWSSNMPASATRQHGAGVGYPGYRGQGGTGYPQHKQYGNPPRYPAADQATQSSPAQNNAVTVRQMGHRLSTRPAQQNRAG